MIAYEKSRDELDSRNNVVVLFLQKFPLEVRFNGTFYAAGKFLISPINNVGFALG